MNAIQKKTILSMRIARELLAMGFEIIDIQYSKKFPGKPAYIFRDCDALQEHLTKSERG